MYYISYKPCFAKSSLNSSAVSAKKNHFFKLAFNKFLKAFSIWFVTIFCFVREWESPFCHGLLLWKNLPNVCFGWKCIVNFTCKNACILYLRNSVQFVLSSL